MLGATNPTEIDLRTQLVIPVTTGTGRAPTEIAAFDAALLAAGVGDVNLVPLSSVIPAGAMVTTGPSTPNGEWGDRLYVVISERRESRPGVMAVAGLGWIQEADHGPGLFVEISGDDEGAVVDDVEASLAAMAANRPARRFGPPQIVTRAARCEREPVCSLVVAAYEAVGWSGGRRMR